MLDNLGGQLLNLNLDLIIQAHYMVVVMGMVMLVDILLLLLVEGAIVAKEIEFL